MSETMNYRMSENVDKLFEALGLAQLVMTGAVRDANNPFFSSKYADLASVWDACRRPLADNGLTVIQPVSADGAKVTISTVLAHKTGQWIASELTLTSSKPDPQSIGSAITYGRRYGLSAMVGIAPEDDDGNAASGGEKVEPARPRTPSDPQPTPITSKAPIGTALTAIKALKDEIGEKPYYACLERHGVKKFGDIKSQEQAKALLDELGQIRAAIVAASHGEVVKGMDELLFMSLPEESRASVLLEMKSKLSSAVGSQATAEEEFERLRSACDAPWEFYKALDNALEFYCTSVAKK